MVIKMTILEKMDSLLAKKAKYQEEIIKESDSIKKEFESYIKDKSIPLEKRWTLFLNSPDEINNHSEWLIKTKSKGMKHILEGFEDSPEVYGRGKKVIVKELFEDVFLIDQKIFNDLDYDEKELFLNKDAMEELLSKNCGSFCIDW